MSPSLTPLRSVAPYWNTAPVGRLDQLDLVFLFVSRLASARCRRSNRNLKCRDSVSESMVVLHFTFRSLRMFGNLFFQILCGLADPILLRAVAVGFFSCLCGRLRVQRLQLSGLGG